MGWPFCQKMCYFRLRGKKEGQERASIYRVYWDQCPQAQGRGRLEELKKSLRGTRGTREAEQEHMRGTTGGQKMYSRGTCTWNEQQMSSNNVTFGESWLHLCTIHPVSCNTTHNEAQYNPYWTMVQDILYWARTCSILLNKALYALLFSKNLSVKIWISLHPVLGFFLANGFHLICI